MNTIDLTDFPQGTWDPKRSPSRAIFCTIEELEKLPPRLYKIVTDPTQIQAARENLKSSEWHRMMSVENSWNENAASGRVICVWRSAL